MNGHCSNYCVNDCCSSVPLTASGRYIGVCGQKKSLQSSETWELLYHSIFEPVVTYCSICYYPALSVSNCNRLLRISHLASKIIGVPTSVLSVMINRAVLRKARAVAADSDPFVLICSSV